MEAEPSLKASTLSLVPTSPVFSDLGMLVREDVGQVQTEVKEHILSKEIMADLFCTFLLKSKWLSSFLISMPQVIPKQFKDESSSQSLGFMAALIYPSTSPEQTTERPGL